MTFSFKYKINEIINNFSLTGDKFMPEKHLKKFGFTNSASGPFTKSKKRIETFIETGNTNFTYRNYLDKVCIQHGMAYCKHKDLAKRSNQISF